VKRFVLWLPLVAVAGLLLVVSIGLYHPASREVRSAMIGKPLPEFNLVPIVPGKPGVGTASFRQGKAKLLNVFASWCIPCAAEAPQLARLKAMGVEIDAIAIRDRTPDLQEFLARYGDPFAALGDDPDSSVQLALGSSGVPESFVVDGQGHILLQHIGEIREEDVDAIAAAVRKGR
jgi:cytochrome c biogenesis protein CcmG/thiol:disulfide interchange protein DsbE